MKYKFSSIIEKIHFEITRDVAKAVYNNAFDAVMEDKIAQAAAPGPIPMHRSSIAKERAIAKERIQYLKGGFADTKHVINVIPLACDHCPTGGWTITDACRGCVGHPCLMTCPKQAITIDDKHRAHIDKSKCINCGMCSKACPFSAIQNYYRPCEKACKSGAMGIAEDGTSKIDHSKCFDCGHCMAACPFGAITDKSQVVKLVELLRDSLNGKVNKTIYAVVAPSIAAQMAPCTVEQTAEALTKLGFNKVVEAALGADMVALGEAKELMEKKVLTSSCCPAFVQHILKNHPELKDKVSSNLSPMVTIAKFIKEKNPESIICFVGPCTAKKKEALKESAKPYVDYVITFSEMRGMFAALDIEVDKLKGITLDDATGYGRGFATCGGLAKAIVEVLKEYSVKYDDFKLSALSCDGIENCEKALKALSAGDHTYNFIEGMACVGGCVGGPSSTSANRVISKFLIDTHSKKNVSKSIKDIVEKSNKK